MRKKKLRKIIYLLISTLIIAISTLILKWHNEFAHIEEINKIVETPFYSLKVDYPVIADKKINRKIRDYITKQEKEFLSQVEQNKSAGFYEFKANYKKTKIKNIECIHITTYKHLEKNYYIRDDFVICYDEKSFDEIDFAYFLESDTFNIFKQIVRRNFFKYFKDTNQSFDEDQINVTTDKISDYKIFEFKKDYLSLTFSLSSDEIITINIPNTELESIIKKDFLELKEEEIVFADLPEKRDLNQFAGKKLLAFTFDDGPSGRTTTKLLDNLDKYNARVTFFVLGSRAETFKSNLLRAYQMGNTIGNHTYNHLNLYKETPEIQLDEIENTNEVIEEITGTKPRFLRPPYGNLNNEVKGKSGMNTILWNIDTEDWKKKNADKIAEHIIKNAHDGAIILLHDIYTYSIDGALKAMDELKDEYAFVSLDEMIALKGQNLEILKTYYGF